MYNEVFNIFLGLSLGLIISHILKDKYLYHGPNSNEVKKLLFKKNNKCYKLKTIKVNCSLFGNHD